MTWGIYCFLHQLIKKKCPLVKQFSIPLDQHDLFNLRLNEILAIEACLGICNYIANYNNSNPQLFSKKPRKEEETFQFISQYFDTDQNLMKILG